MGQTAAKQGDQITGLCTHTVQPPGSPPPPTIVESHSFSGLLDKNLSPDVNIMRMPAATVDSTATNNPVHVTANGAFAPEPTNIATVNMGSPTVNINGKAAARSGDTAQLCDNGVPVANGVVVAVGTVNMG